MFERFTDRARRVVVLAQEEARLLNHNYIGTEHILLGLIHEEKGVAARVLQSFGLTLNKVKADIVELIGEGGQTPTGHIPFTPRAKKVLELSLREALSLGHNYIGTEHILLGLIREEESATDDDGVATQIFTRHSLAASKIRQAVLDALAKTGHSTSADIPADLKVTVEMSAKQRRAALSKFHLLKRGYGWSESPADPLFQAIADSRSGKFTLPICDIESGLRWIRLLMVEIMPQNHPLSLASRTLEAAIADAKGAYRVEHPYPPT